MKMLNTTLNIQTGVKALAFFLLNAAVIAFGAAASDESAAVSEGFHLSASELKIWNDPAFQKSFADSYVAETEIEPRVTVDEREQMMKILDLISSDKIDDAAKQIQKELSRNAAASAVYDFTLANIYFQREDLDKAAAAYLAAVEKYPKFRRAWRNLGLIYVRQGEFNKALPTLTRVVELGGNDAITMGLLGFAYASVDNNLCAESAYRMAILLDPETLDWKMGLARSFFKQQRYAEAVAICGQLIGQYPERADLWLLQANAYIGLGQPLKAAEIYEIVDSLGQATVQSLNMLGDIYINEELYEMAAQVYLKAMQKDPQYDVARAIRSAKVLIARSAFKETRQIIESIENRFADRLDTNVRKDILKLRARLAVADGSGGDEEVRVLKQIIELDPLDGEALILLGQHSARNENTEQAIFYYERAAAIEAFEADANVRHAQVLVGNGKYDEALPLLRRAQQVKPRDNIQKYLEQVERVAKNR